MPGREPGRAARAVLAVCVLGLSAVLACTGCGYTASPALLPPHLKTVAIPVFENGTPETQLEQQVTDAVIQRFVKDNHLKIVDEKSATSVVRGKVTSYKNAVYGFTANTTTANAFRISITVQVTFKDLVKNRELWTGEIVKSAIYYVQPVPGQEVKTDLDGRKEAIDKIADEILSRSVEGW